MIFRKPVFTFGSHSLAGYFYFLLFYLNFESYRVERRTIDLTLAIGCIGAGLLLTSITSAVLMTLAVIMLVVRSGHARWPLLLVLTVTIGTVWWGYRAEIADLIAVSNMIASLESSGSGLRGRFGKEGNLLGSIETILRMPLRPIGLSFSPAVFYGDSGPVEYMLRGSWPLLISVYGGFALFLRHSLRWRSHALVLFLATVAFEIGMTVLTYHRFGFFLLFTVMHLNHLADADSRVRRREYNMEWGAA
jgi:hypothetical protein